MTSDAPAQGDAGSGTRYFVRRLPDVVSRWRRRRCYEVGTFPPNRSIPVEVQHTKNPGTVLLRAGLHTTDIADYLNNADGAWEGGTGPWRGMWPDRDP